MQQYQQLQRQRKKKNPFVNAGELTDSKIFSIAPWNLNKWLWPRRRVIFECMCVSVCRRHIYKLVSFLLAKTFASCNLAKLIIHQAHDRRIFRLSQSDSRKKNSFSRALHGCELDLFFHVAKWIHRATLSVSPFHRR